MAVDNIVHSQISASMLACASLFVGGMVINETVLRMA
jgi:hypothetical protein